MALVHEVIKPAVAAEWTASDDLRQWSFKLRPDAKWSNGDPVTAGDFVYSWRRLANPETASEYAWFIELMNVENATQLQWALNDATKDADVVVMTAAVADYRPEREAKEKLKRGELGLQLPEKIAFAGAGVHLSRR